MNLYLNEFYDCKENEIIVSKQKINCKYWNIDNPCNPDCSLKVLNNPTPSQCNYCKKRDPIVLGDIETDVSVPEIKPEEKSFFQKAITYVTAEASQFVNGKVSEEVYEKRKNICLACHFKTNPSPHIEPIGWCKGGCGCKVGNPRAGLSEKLHMPTISCPLNKFDYEKGSGFKVSDAIDSLKGIKTSLVENLKTNDKE